MTTMLCSTDPEHAQHVCSRAYYPLTLDVLGRRASFRMAMSMVRSGPVTIGDIRYDTDVRVSCGELGTAYHVNVPLAGALETEHRGETSVVDRATAAVYHPTGDTTLHRWPGDCRQLCVKLDREAVDTELENLLGTSAHRPLTLAGTLDLASGHGRRWASLVALLAGETDPDDLLSGRHTGPHLGRALVSGLLLAVPHSYSEQLHDDVSPCRPRTVKRVTDAIEADASANDTLADLARIAGVSARALQAGFAEHVGVPPMAYLRTARLARAHRELEAGTPDLLTVAEVARRWGFGHLGRFAQTYRRTYGRSPSTTLRSRGRR